MRTQLQQYRAHQMRRSKRGRPADTVRVEAELKQSNDQFYQTQGPASPVRRINPLTGDVTEIIDTKKR